MTDNSILLNSSTVRSNLETVTHGISLPTQCQEVIFSDMDYLPWDNADNIVSVEVETGAHRVKDTVLVLLFLIGGPGNVINMAVFYKQGFKDRVNLCLFALSLADELFLIVAMCHYAEQAYSQFTTKETFGYLITFLVNNHLTGLLGFVYVSQVLSAIIASERCYCVLRPLKFQSLMRNRTMMLIIIVVYASIVGLYFIATFRFHIGCIYNPQSGLTEKALVIGPLYHDYREIVDYLDGFIFGAGVPGGAMIVTAAATTITTVKLHQIVTWRAGTSSSISPREVALTKMLVGASILFIVCISPLAVARISWLFLPEMNAGRRNQNFYLTTLWIGELLTYINSSFNICVYYVMGSRYRETVSSLFTRKSM